MALDVARIKKDFPLLQQQIDGHRLVYLDSAASSQKPQAVLDAMDEVYTTYFANVHRSVYKIAAESTERYEEARGKIATFINSPSPSNVVFGKNVTEVINLVAYVIGTAVLLAEAPAPPPTGNLLDLGSGWGPIALSLGLRSPGASIWAVDVNQRALSLARDNAKALGVNDFHAVTPDEVPADIRFDAIWSNPPIRVGKAALHDLLRQWLVRLAPGGTAYLVVQKNLGSDSLQRWLATELEDMEPGAFVVGRHTTARTFRVLSVHRTEV